MPVSEYDRRRWDWIQDWLGEAWEFAGRFAAGARNGVYRDMAEFNARAEFALDL